jgi:hypothetical protein
LGSKPTKRRSRKPETLAFLHRAWQGELADFEVPVAFRAGRRKGDKFLAAALKYRAAQFEWSGQDARGNDAAILRRVAQGLQAARWQACADIAARYDAQNGAIRRLLEERAPRWCSAEQRCRAHTFVRRRREALEADPNFAPFVRAARAQLQEELDGEALPGWHPGGAWTRGRQLRHELADGARKHAKHKQPLDARIRDLRRNARERGEFPLHRPRASSTNTGYGPPSVIVRSQAE